MSTLLRLAKSVEAVFVERMSEAFPERFAKMTHRIQEVRGGRHDGWRIFFEASRHWAVLDDD